MNARLFFDHNYHPAHTARWLVALCLFAALSALEAAGATGTVVSLGGPPVPPGLDDIIAISAGPTHCLAVRSNGTVVGWGTAQFGAATPPAGLSNVVAVAAGGDFSVALKSDSSVVTWGFNSKIKKMPVGLAGVGALSAANDYTIALMTNGTEVHWGGLAVGVAPAGATNLVAVAAGDNQGYTLQADGSVVIPGFLPGQGTVKSNVMGLAAEGSTLVLLHQDGTVEGLGIDIPAGLSNVVAVSAGLALQSDGSVVGLDAPLPTALTHVTAISGSVHNGLVITTNPPAPELAAGVSSNSFRLSAPVSVSGYALEASANANGPFNLLSISTNPPSTLVFPRDGTNQFFRFRKL